MSQIKFAIDFDSSYTNVYKLGAGLVLSEPTVCAVEDDGGFKIKALGKDAYKLIGKTTKSTKIVFPVFEGEIVNEKVAAEMLFGFLAKVGYTSKLLGCSAIFGVPCGATQEMLEKYKRVANVVGIGKVYFAEKPLLSALGQRIALTDSSARFVIDMSGGTTSIAAISLSGVISGLSINYGSNKISADIIDYVAEKFGVQIGLQTAEKLKREISSLEDGDGLSLIVSGRDVKTGEVKTLTIRSDSIMQPIKQYYDKIYQIASEVIKKLPPETSAEIRRSGIYVSGVSSKAYGLEKYYADKFGLKVSVAEDGLYSVAIGGGIAIADKETLKKVCIDL
ncbi:MAG: rod shape-determining protein [Clostridia bacterium]|nr:rod shape-determining protein [Clostridia bacterium]